MMEESKKLITIENGKKIQYDIIIEFSSNKNNKNYVVYTNNIKDNNGNVNVLSAIYEKDIKNENIYTLHPIESKEELDMINNILKDFIK